ncbi:hypothetical protein C9I56_34980 [Paraburkholderia caribensis]|nr:hypothetical protein C9I56_34980 [Paraburkholderia caribensis]
MYFDETDPNISQLTFDSCEFIDDDGIQRTQQIDDIAFVRNKMVRVDYTIAVLDGKASFIINLFFWPRVF